MKVWIQRRAEEKEILRGREWLESIWGDIDRYNIKTMANGQQWVIDAMTGEAILRENAQFFQDAKGNVMWIPAGLKLSVLDQPKFYKWKNPEK